jgi:hypothetical protein
MHLKASSIATLLLGCLLAVPGPLGAAVAQPAHNIPPSDAMEHESTLGYLEALAHRTTPTGAAALRVMEVMKAHMAVEEEFILPPLTLLPSLAAGTVTPDMRWAIAMSDRVRAERNNLQQMHAGITAAILDLKAAAEAENDEATVGFTKDLAADDLSDVEITEPVVLIIGDLLRSKLPPQ